MAVKNWEKLKTIYCERASAEVVLEVEVVYPSEPLPDQAPRILGHRCSLALGCAANGNSNCCWTGTNPVYDPFGVMN